MFAVVMLEKDLVEKIFQHFLKILRQSELQSEQELLLLLDILQNFLANCENNVSQFVCMLYGYVCLFKKPRHKS